MKRFSTIDLVVIVIVGVVWGFIGVWAGGIYAALMGMGGIYLANATYILFTAPSQQGGYIVRLPLAAAITGLIHGATEMLAGNPMGLWAIAFGLTQGVGSEIGYALFRYKRWDLVSVAVAGGLSLILSIPLLYIAFGYGGMAFGAWFGPTIVAFISASVGAILIKWLTDGILRTGALSGTAIAKEALEARLGSETAR